MKPYKHALSLTSQVPFCGVPLRLDAFDRCQFSCSYCFAKARGGSRGRSAASVASADAIKRRLTRVAAGQISSALDEMLAMRVPIQFGGMTDPFSILEERTGVALKLLRVLADFDYPTLISTKSTLLGSPPYLNLLQAGNFYVRVSFTGAAPSVATTLEGNVPSQAARLELIGLLAEAGIATSGRLQPLLLGAHDDARVLIGALGQRGARHVSVEFLKWPVENSLHQNIVLSRALPGMLERYVQLGATRVGREYVLPAEVKLSTFLMLREEAVASGMIFGFADNEFLHLNKFEACCNASDLFLRDSHFFKANILGALKRGLAKDKIKFADVSGDWQPARSINNYLNSRSRSRGAMTPSEPEWERYLRAKWNGSSIRGGPLAFWGIEALSGKDEFGNVVFKAKDDLRKLLSKSAFSMEVEN